MRLLFCPVCGDMLMLFNDDTRTCRCGESWASVATNGLFSKVYGHGVLIGLNLTSLAIALRDAPKKNQPVDFGVAVLPATHPTTTPVYPPPPTEES